MNFILLTFLVFIAFSSSYSISKVKRHIKELHGEEDTNSIYKVEDDGKTVKFSFPKQEKPTLREIVYYHVIEEPYPGESYHGSIEVSEESKSETKSSSEEENDDEDDDVVVTERPFTNGHGYQFLFNDTDANDSSADSTEVEDATTEIVDTDHDEETIFTEPEFDEEEEKEFEKLIAEIYATETPDETTVKPENEQQTSAMSTPKTPSKTEDIKTDKIKEGKLSIPSANKTLSKTEEQEVRNTELSNFNVTDTSETLEEKLAEIEDKGQEVSSTETEEVTEIDIPSLIDAKNDLNKDDVLEEKKSARASLFSQAREKYQNKMGKKQQRRKREVKSTYMPEAPRLSPLNLDSLPEYVRKLISQPAPEMTTRKIPLENSNKFDEEALQKELEDRIEGIMASLKPKLLEDSDSASNEDEGSSYQVEDDENETEDIWDKVENGKTKQARTYGMNMTQGRGYVWNDLLGDPGMYIEVGEPDDENEITEHNEPTETPIELSSSTHYSTESKPIYMNDPTIEENSDKEVKKDDDNDIFVEVKTNKPIYVTEHSTEKILSDQSLTETQTAKNEHLDKKSLKGDENIKESNIEKPTTEKIDISTDKSKQQDVINGDNDTTTVRNKNEDYFSEASIESTTKLDVNDVATDSTKTEEKVNATMEQTIKNKENNIKLSDLDTQKEEGMDEKVKKKIIEITKSEILQELFKNDEFWQWLGGWTTKYTEQLMKHIKHMIHDEVGRQMKKQTSNLKKQIQKDIEEALKLKEKSDLDEKEISNNQTDKQKTPGEVTNLEGNSVEKIGSENKEKPSDLEKEDSKINETDTGITINNDKIIIDGKEIPITHNTNFDNENLLKRKKDKDREENKHHTDHFDLEIKDETKEKANVTNDKPQINVTAQNIYGNSAGSEKVTNIFIFYPHENKDINDFKPFGNDNQENVFLIDKRKEEAETDLIEHKDESTSTTDEPTTVKPKQESKEEIGTTTVAQQDIVTTQKPQEETEKPKEIIGETTSTTVIPQDISITEQSKENIATTTVAPQDILTTAKSNEEIKEENDKVKEGTTTTTAVPEEITTTEKSKEEIKDVTDATKEGTTATTAVPQEIPTTEKSKEEIVTTTIAPQDISTTEKSKEEIKEVTDKTKEGTTTTTVAPEEITTTTEKSKEEIITTTTVPQDVTT